jgi:hypothetical protein
MATYHAYECGWMAALYKSAIVPGALPLAPAKTLLAIRVLLTAPIREIVQV